MNQSTYCDGRNSATYRMEAKDQGIVFESGKGPDDCDYLGARETWAFEHGGEYLQFFSASVKKDFGRGVEIKRTLGIARTKDLDGPWSLDPEPLAPLDDQIENSDLYYEPANGYWFLFTNHVGIVPDSELPAGGGPEAIEGTTAEFTDAVWVYWSKDPNHWNPEHKAVVLDGKNYTWAKRCIGLPGVIVRDGRLAILYDGAPGESVSHMRRHIGLAWLDLPLVPPTLPES